MPLKSRSLIIVTLFLGSAAAQDQETGNYDPLFIGHDTLEAEVEAPFLYLTRERPEEDEADGKFRYVDVDGTWYELDVRIRTRGNWRRNPEVCDFPPMRFNFRKSQTDDTLFDKQDKLKVVTHCQDNKHYAQSVVSEYLAYRILNELTDYSYRVRLVNLTYIYTDRSRTINSYAILIEHKDRLGKRIDGKPVVTERTPTSSIHSYDLVLTSVFHYLLGNTDFSPRATVPDDECCHNQSLFSSKDGPYRTIPYDFDQTGFVDARHAAPNPRFGLRSVKERLYRGHCRNNELLPQALQHLRDKRPRIEALIQDQPELTGPTRRDLLRYVDTFYEVINDPRKVQKELVSECLGR